MTYQVETVSELDGKTLAAGAEKIVKYISSKNCTALMVGVQVKETGGTIPTAANIHTKIGTIEIAASNKDGGGIKVSLDVDDIPPIIEKMSAKPGVSITGIMGTQGDTRIQHYQYWIPLSPDPWSNKFGYRDARIQFQTTGTNTAITSTATKLYVAALLHDEAPQYYIEMKNNAFTATSGTNKDLDLPEGGSLMGAYAFGTTSLHDLSTTDAPTIDQLALLVDNNERERINTRCINAFNPVGVYMVAGTTVTQTSGIGGADYMFWDLGYKKGFGIPIGRNYKLRIKPLASNAVRIYPVISHRVVG